MGMDVSVKVVAGVKWEKIYRKVTRTEKVRRYHEVTGEPYDKEISTLCHMVGNRPIPDEEIQNWLYSDSKPGKLELYDTGSNRAIGEGDPIFGRLVCKTESNHRVGQEGMITELDLAKCQKQMDSVQKILEQHYGTTKPKVGLFVVPYFSY